LGKVSASVVAPRFAREFASHDVKQPRSPDCAERKPGTINRLYRRSRLSLRSIRATKKEKKEKGKRNAGRRSI
jgi:hypothetical protein